MPKKAQKKEYTWITITEAAARMGTNSRRIIYLLEKKELTDNGRKGRQRRVKWEGVSSNDQKLNLKEQLTAVQIKKIEQQLAEGRASIKQELLDEVMLEVYERIKNLKALTMNLGLSADKMEWLRKEWKKTFPNV